MKTIEQFWREIVTDKELADKLSKAYNEKSVDSFLSANQVDGTKEQFRRFFLDKRRQFSEYTDPELAKITGGGWADCDKGYKSGSTPKFNPGEVVKYDMYDDLAELTVIKVMKNSDGRYDMGGLFWKEFKYVIRTHYNGETVENVYESELLKC
ncbi:MAG: hypothetical protein ACI4SX_01830 [Candidatus Fimenecus sp.]